MRGIRKMEQVEAYEKFLTKLYGKDRLELRVDDSIFQTATNIAIIYGRSKFSDIEYGDCLIAAQMYKYAHSNLYLATQNHDDFPRLIFDRVGVYTIDGRKSDQIFNIGIYTFNKSRFEKLLSDFDTK
jgi:predicted nucleic acid-binding protein